MFVTGPGAGARNSIGRVLVPGMVIGTFFTLFVVPAIYLFLTKNHSKDRDRRGQAPPKTEERKLQPALT
jgi:multidrug efflux pump